MATLTGGDKLEAYLADLAKKVSNPGTLEVGFRGGQVYPDTGTSVAMVAAIQEFGAPNKSIPPRPFFRSMIAKESPHWGADMAKFLKRNDFDGKAALNDMGQEIHGELYESIATLTEPPLSAVTLMLRKMKQNDPSLVVTGRTVGEAAARVAAGKSYAGVSTKPLIEPGSGGGLMLASITSAVV